MAASKQKPQNLSQVWPVVLNSSLKNSEIHRLLEKNHKVRVAENTIEDSVIFPLSAVAFVILPLALARLMTERNERQCENSFLDPKIIQRIEKFQQIHRHCYTIVCAAQMKEVELQILTALQRRFLSSSLGFIPVHNNQECLDCMSNIAKVTCKPLKSIIQERLKKLELSTISEDVVLHILSNLGLSSHDCLVLQHGCQSLAAVATATQEQLMDCSLDQQTAQQIMNFFTKDCLQI